MKKGTFKVPFFLLESKVQVDYKKELNLVVKNEKTLQIWRVLSGRQDSNLRPSGPKPDALPGCATPRIRVTE